MPKGAKNEEENLHKGERRQKAEDRAPTPLLVLGRGGGELLALASPYTGPVVLGESLPLWEALVPSSGKEMVRFALPHPSDPPKAWMGLMTGSHQDM